AGQREDAPGVPKHKGGTAEGSRRRFRLLRRAGSGRLQKVQRDTGPRIRRCGLQNDESGASGPARDSHEPRRTEGFEQQGGVHRRRDGTAVSRRHRQRGVQNAGRYTARSVARAAGDHPGDCEMKYLLAPLLAKCALPLFEGAAWLYLKIAYRVPRLFEDLDWPNELEGWDWYAGLFRRLCGWNNHASVVWYNPGGFEPDMTCTRCGE